MKVLGNSYAQNIPSFCGKATLWFSKTSERILGGVVFAQDVEALWLGQTIDLYGTNTQAYKVTTIDLKCSMVTTVHYGSVKYGHFFEISLDY